MTEFILWGQRGGNGNIWDALGPVILLAVFILLRLLGAAMQGNVKNQAVKNQKEQKMPPELQVRSAEDGGEFLLQLIKDSRKKERSEKTEKKKRKSRPQRLNEPYGELASESRPVRTVLAKELTPQGTGSRFESEPGTLNPSSIVAPSIEPTVKPELESLTGIYDEPASNAESAAYSGLQQSGLYALLAQPEGIRNAVVLSEIFSRKESVFGKQ